MSSMNNGRISTDLVEDACKECMHSSVCGKKSKLLDFSAEIQNTMRVSAYCGFRVEIVCEHMLKKDDSIKEESECLFAITSTSEDFKDRLNFKNPFEEIPNKKESK